MGGLVEDPCFVEPLLRLSGDATPNDHREVNDDNFQQADDLFLWRWSLRRPVRLTLTRPEKRS